MDKYTTLALSTQPSEKDKIIISNDAYAIIDVLERLVFRLGRI